jgi:hypothetical protein
LTRLSIPERLDKPAVKIQVAAVSEEATMPPATVPQQVVDMMLYRGAIIVFGPDYLEATVSLQKELQQQDSGGFAWLSCKRTDEISDPRTLMLFGMIVFAHYVPGCEGRAVGRAELEPWKNALLSGVVFRASKPLTNVPPDDADEEPKEIRLISNQTDNKVILLARWGAVESNHCFAVARAIEQSYVRHGGYY